MSGNKDDKALRGRKKVATMVIRIVLGVLFFVSGLLKLNDPMGLVFKMQEYLSPSVFDMSLSQALLVDVAGALITLEMILGASLLMGRFKIFTLWTLLGLNAVFVFLTLYSAVTGVVTDCGCFGEAVHLSPWASFVKSVVIVILVILLIVWQRFIKPAVGFRTSMSVVALLFALSIGVSYYTLRYEPLVDFRPYKVGIDIREAMKIPQGKDAPVFEHAWTYRVEGEEREYSDRQEPWNIPGAEFVSRRTKLISGKLPRIVGFYVTTPDGRDMTDSLLLMDRVLLVTCFDPLTAEAQGWENMDDYLDREEAPAFLLAGTSDTSFVRRTGLTLPVLYADPMELKTIMRSNPGVMELKKGVITAKRSCFGLDD